MVPTSNGLNGSESTSHSAVKILRYQAELARCELELLSHHAWYRRLVAIRAMLFLAGVGCLGAAYFRSERSIVLIAAGWGFIVAFVTAVIIFDQIEQKMHCGRIDIRLFRRLMARWNRDWSGLAQKRFKDLESSDEEHRSQLATADDLDLLGERSLLSWSSIAGTTIGIREHANQLVKFAEEATVKERQVAAIEMAPQFDMRLKLVRLLWQMGDLPDSLDVFAEWAGRANPISAIVNRLSQIGPAMVLGGSLIALLGGSANLMMLVMFGGAVVVLGLIINLVLLLGFVGVIHNGLVQIDRHRNLEATCQGLFEAIEALKPKSKLLIELFQNLSDPHKETSALVALRQLRWPMRLAGLRLNPGLYIPFIVLQIFFLWDFRVYSWIERWRKRFSEEVPRWVMSIGQLEVILSASSLVDEYPDWTFVESLTDDSRLFQSEGMGHPLIATESRVTNDLEISKDQPVLLVTGSNMSGKSTLMRTVGVNLALSRTGAPVCANTFRCGPMEIATSIRVRDSLADGVSFFMAELNRLKQVVDAVQDSRRYHDRTTLVILDEILQGTNSRERQIAVNHVVEKLLLSKAMIMVSTHDLLLSETGAFQGTSQIVHFREHFVEVDGKSEMRFCYQMYPGLAPTTNALKLLELVGL